MFWLPLQPLQAHPLPFLQLLSLDMQLSPQAFPDLQTLQQPSLANAMLHTGPAAGVMVAKDSAIPANRNFIFAYPPLLRDKSI